MKSTIDMQFTTNRWLWIMLIHTRLLSWGYISNPGKKERLKFSLMSIFSDRNVGSWKQCPMNAGGPLTCLSVGWMVVPDFAPPPCQSGTLLLSPVLHFGEKLLCVNVALFDTSWSEPPMPVSSPTDISWNALKSQAGKKMPLVRPSCLELP